MGLKNATLYEKAQVDAIELQTRLNQIKAARSKRRSSRRNFTVPGRWRPSAPWPEA